MPLEHYVYGLVLGPIDEDLQVLQKFFEMPGPVFDLRLLHQQHAQGGDLSDGKLRIAIKMQGGFQGRQGHFVDTQGSGQRIGFDLIDNGLADKICPKI